MRAKGSRRVLMVSALSWVCFGVGCVSIADKERLETDIFNLKTKLLALESSVQGGSKNQASANSSLASLQANLEKIDLELKKLNGQIDTLRVGVVTGELPGRSEEDLPSIAQSLRDLTDRMDSLETNQAALLEAIDKASKGQVKKKSLGRKESLSLSALEADYKKKRYKYVVLDSEKALAKAPKGDQDRIHFLQAESLYRLGRLRDAALKFNEYLERKPKDSIAHAKMRLGDCFRHLGDKDTAKLYYEDLLSQYPSTAEAEKAKDRLGKL